MENTLPQNIRALATAIDGAGGRAYLVGGAVRDVLLGLKCKDYDLEVYGLGVEELEKLLGKFGAVHLIGKQFAVLLLVFADGEEVEVALPRRESKTGPGHKGFAVKSDPHMRKEDAVLRRDFTINALMQDILSGEIFDFHDGLGDLKRKTLRHVSPAFAEDPLRVLRAARFVARFDFVIASETVELCRSLDVSELPRERIEGEFRLMLEKCDFPGKGLLALEACGALRSFPELECLRGVPQDPEWHPEGDVMIHTALCLDAAILRRDEMEDIWVEMLGVMCHDLGKATHTSFERGRWRCPAHDVAGVKPTISLLEKINGTSNVVAPVCDLVREHLRPGQLYIERESVTDAAIRRLATRVNIPALCRVAFADFAGRLKPFELPWTPEVWLLERAAGLGVKDAPLKNFLRGQDVIAVGVEPGPQIGDILDEAYALQIEGELMNREQSLEWLCKRC
ncbi:MAG: tRNA nucleotidyltransferase (CCA-adding enzyme) [Myxococcota bacterium]|jgi:tRNA nucleotidyltransferase (CCA-adding enzyme)